MDWVRCKIVLSWTSFKPVVVIKEETFTESLPARPWKPWCCRRSTGHRTKAVTLALLAGFHLVSEIGKRFVEEVAFVPDPEKLVSTGGNWEARLFQSQQRYQSSPVQRQSTDLAVEIDFSHYYWHQFYCHVSPFSFSREKRGGGQTHQRGANSDGKDQISRFIPIERSIKQRFLTWDCCPVWIMDRLQKVCGVFSFLLLWNYIQNSMYFRMRFWPLSSIPLSQWTGATNLIVKIQDINWPTFLVVRVTIQLLIDSLLLPAST